MIEDSATSAATSLDNGDSSDNNSITISAYQPEQSELKRNLAGFWLLGLCNNFGYVVMLSAAYDILSEQEGHKEEKPVDGFHCNPKSTGVVLLADVLPTLIVKLTAPFYMQRINYHFRVMCTIFLLVASLLTVAYSQSVGVSLLGVVFASLSSGLGEITFLSISTHFKKTTVSTWSSGTGMAGVAGALSYAGLKATGLSSRNTLLVLLIVPVVFALTFWILLKFPSELSIKALKEDESNETEPLLENTNNVRKDKTAHMSLRMKLTLIIPLLKYMVPLFLVYLAEYTINQGLFELLYYENSFLDQASQYRWFQVDYQVGVFISRSSVNLFQLKKIYIPVIIQYVILTTLLLEICFPFLHYIWFVLGIVFLEGLCGGAVYVNAFYLISEEVPCEVREFSMGLASVSDSCGIAIAGGIAIPIHDSLCKLKLN